VARGILQSPLEVRHNRNARLCRLGWTLVNRPGPNFSERLAIPMRSFAGRGSLLLALICAALPIHAAQVVVVLRPGGTEWRVVEAEKITFNQRIRCVSDPASLWSSAGPRTTSSRTRKESWGVGRCAGRPADTWCGARRAAGFRWLRTGTRGKPPLPTRLCGRRPRWRTRPTLKAKTLTPLRADEIYAILPGPDQSEALANLIADERNFPGVGRRKRRRRFHGAHVAAGCGSQFRHRTRRHEIAAGPAGAHVGRRQEGERRHRQGRRSAARLKYAEVSARPIPTTRSRRRHAPH